MPRLRAHPGDLLHREFLTPLGLSGRQLAAALGVPQNRITDLLRGKRRITADTAHRLARYFDTTPQFWMNLQANFDLAEAEDATDYSGVPTRPMADSET
jgi:addiction module HigA family antidote